MALTTRGLRLGTERGTFAVPRAALSEPGGALSLAQRLAERVAGLPDGEVRRARQAALDRRQASPGRPLVGPALAALCVGFHVLASAFPNVAYGGEYWRALGLALEPWRLLTAQLLHAGIPHLALNALGLFVLGGLLERQLGASRTVLVSAAAAAGAMLGCVAAGYESVVGVSGVVAGYAGALIALELRRPDLLPATLRLPRGVLVGAVLAEFVALSFVPNVAHGAHAGGLLAGGVAALAIAPDAASSFAAGRGLRVAAAAALGISLALLLGFAHGLLDPGTAAARRGELLLEARRAVPVLLLNNDAWTIATSADPTEDELELALQLARRAVRATDRTDPNYLDTLAEVYFQLGRGEEAVATIERAISLAPGEPYFEEQRRRFVGERAPDDRPDPPEQLPEGGEPERPGLEPSGPGVEV